MTLRRVALPLAAVVLLGSAAPAPLAAQSRVTTSVDTTRVTMGDRITVTVSVEHPSGSTVAWPDSVALAPFEVLEARATPPRASGGGLVSTLSLHLAAFELGELELGAFDVTVTGPDGATETLATDRYGIEVVSVGQDEGGDIRSIRGPVSMPVSPLRLLLTLLLVLLPLLLAVLAYRRFRRTDDAAGPVRRGPPPRQAHELALEALAELERSSLLERGESKAYHIRVSQILRTYVERRYRIDALEMTTVEVLRGLEAAGVDEGIRRDLGRFLDQCDFVKFAKGRPPMDECRAVLALGRRLVEDTTPTEHEPGPALALGRRLVEDTTPTFTVPDVDQPDDRDAATGGTGAGERAGPGGERDAVAATGESSAARAATGESSAGRATPAEAS